MTDDTKTPIATEPALADDLSEGDSPDGSPGDNTGTTAPSSSIDPDAEPLPDNRAPAVLDDTAPGGHGWFDRLMMALRVRSASSLRDDLNEALAPGGEGGDAFSPEERALLHNILRFREQRVEDVMVPRAEIHAVSLDDTLRDVLLEFQDNGHSRMPVYDETQDDPAGMVLVKDLLLHITREAEPPKPKKGARKPKPGTKEASFDLARVSMTTTLRDSGVMRKVLFVPPSMLASDLMARIQATRTQMALVIDEYGGTDGLVTLEDIVEEVVGEIEDEHDDEDELVVPQGEGLWLVDARIELDKLVETIGPQFAVGERGDDVDTLGGLAFAMAGHVPVRGEVLRGVPGFELRVLEADPRRIRRLQVVEISAVRRGRAKPRSL